jgi:4-diphosphocytidyl-2-C-methyl-D-erythritol kinase
VEETTLQAIALGLGSDVPYFLGAGSALARGRGELLEYFSLVVPYVILLCYPNIHIATAWAYGQVSPNPREGKPDLRTILIRGLGDPRRLDGELTNDFEPAVIAAHPAIGRIKEAMQQGGSLYASMSGSGSSVYGLFESASAAEQTAGRLSEDDFRTFITPRAFLAPGRP